MLRSSILGIVVLTGLCVAVAVAEPPPAANVAGPNGGMFYTAMVDLPEPSEYVLGVHCAPVDPVLRSQLSLPEKQGVVMLSIVPDSPAAKAGIKQYDILLGADGKLFKTRVDLVAAVEAAKESTMKIELLRGGKRQTIEVAPVKRQTFESEAAEQSAQPHTIAVAQADTVIMRKWIEGMMPKQNGGPPRENVTFRVFRPATIVAQNVIVPKPMPANMSIKIHKIGEEPAKIEVHRGKEEWKLTEKDLYKLPEDVRPFVEQMFGRPGPTLSASFGMVGSASVMSDATPDAPKASDKQPTAIAVPAPPYAVPTPLDIDNRLERHFGEMNRRMDRMFELMERLLEGRQGKAVGSGK